MKKTVLISFALLLNIMILDAYAGSAFAFSKVEKPDLPSNFLDKAAWPKTHTESCMIRPGKEYRSAVYARITNDKKIEYILTTEISNTIFRYEHGRGGGHPEFGISWVKSETHWIRFDLMTEDTKEIGVLFEKHLIDQGIPPIMYGGVCGRQIKTGFGKFWTELFREIGVKE